jgi:hypothetical protein
MSEQEKKLQIEGVVRASNLRPSYLLAMSFRYHFSRVSGVATVATRANRFRPSGLAIAVKRGRWPSAKLSRRESS